MKAKKVIRNSIDAMLMFICRIFVKRKAAVLFNSFSGKYSDNPKYVSEKLHEKAPEIPIYWLMSSENMKNAEIPEYIHKVPIKGRLFYIYYGYRCKVHIDNFAGIRSHKKTNKFRRFIVEVPEQFGISTWHGTPLKYIGHDFSKSIFSEPNISSAKYAIAGCEFTKNKLKSAYPFFEIIMTGTPRNDILINHVKINDSIRKKLKLPSGYKFVLFAPTYRNNDYDSGIRQIQEIDFEKLKRILEKKWGGQWGFIYRLHPHVDCSNIQDICRNSERMLMINGNQYEDMAEYLVVSDLLITDYSSSLFDFMLMDKPCVLLTLDKEHYETVERGMYMNLDELPYPFACTVESLYSQIEQYDFSIVKEMKDIFLKKLGSIEDGKASERIADIIIEYLKGSNEFTMESSKL